MTTMHDLVVYQVQLAHNAWVDLSPSKRMISEGYSEFIAKGLLASPLADIIDLAAEMESMGRVQPEWHPELRELLADWRASRAERPTP